MKRFNWNTFDVVGNTKLPTWPLSIKAPPVAKFTLKIVANPNMKVFTCASASSRLQFQSQNLALECDSIISRMFVSNIFSNGLLVELKKLPIKKGVNKLFVWVGNQLISVNPVSNQACRYYQLALENDLWGPKEEGKIIAYTPANLSSTTFGILYIRYFSHVLFMH